MTDKLAIPARFMLKFKNSAFLFLGFHSAKDSQLPAWTIQYQPSELERTLWRSRNVGIFDMPLEDFVHRLRQQPKTGAAR